MEDVLERALEYYRDRHPKQQGFTFLHCWTLLREVPRWWESPLDVQKRNHGGEGSPGGLAMAAQRAAVPTQPAHEGDVQEPAHDGEGASAEGEGLGSVEGAARELVRPRGQKAAKQDLLEAGRRDSILKTQARATEQMAAANMRRAEAMQDHSAMTLFRMNLEELEQGAREYFELRRIEELERIKQRIEAKKRVADREKAEHDKLMQEREAEVQRAKRPRTATAPPPAAQAPRSTPSAAPLPAAQTAPTLHPASTVQPGPRLPTPPTAAPPSSRDNSELPGTELSHTIQVDASIVESVIFF